MTNDLLNTSLGEIAVQLAGATRVLRQYKLDFCCGGHVILADALTKKEIDPEEVVSQLNALAQPDDTQDWSSKPRAELVDHIYERFHILHRQQLPELLKMARRVEAVHGQRPECPVGLADHIAVMARELESHMQKEEQILFPMLKQDMVAQAAGPIRVMQMEHDSHGDALERLSELTDDLTPPPGACNTWRALYTGLESLRDDLMEHIHLENNVLFKVA